MTSKPRITIHYCTQCSWLLRSAWMAQELLSTFGADLGEVALVPGTGGIFEIHVNGDLIWERKRDGGFPEAKVLKQRVRDLVWPERDLGHSDDHSKGVSFDKLRMRDVGSPGREEEEAGGNGTNPDSAKASRTGGNAPHPEPVQGRKTGGNAPHPEPVQGRKTGGNAPHPEPVEGRKTRE